MTFQRGTYVKRCRCTVVFVGGFVASDNDCSRCKDKLLERLWSLEVPVPSDATSRADPELALDEADRDALDDDIPFCLAS